MHQCMNFFNFPFLVTILCLKKNRFGFGGIRIGNSMTLLYNGIFKNWGRGSAPPTPFPSKSEIHPLAAKFFLAYH